MDLQTVTMPVEEAKQFAAEYRALGERSSDDDKAVLRAFNEIAKGHALIDVARAIPAGGHDDLGRPHLAFARADEFEIKIWREGRSSRAEDGSWLSSYDGDLESIPSDRSRYDRISTARTLEIPAGSLDGWPELRNEWFALVPAIPAALRPKGALSNYHILWEAEWRKASARPTYPRDPALLRHITGTLYAVIAVWDLTEVERLVLGMRRAANPA